MPVQPKFSQIYLRLDLRQQQAFGNWLLNQPGSEFTLPMLAVWNQDPEVFYARLREIPGMTDPDGTDRVVRRLHYLKEALDHFLIWDRLQEKKWLQKALLAEAYGDLALPEMSQSALSGKKMEELEAKDSSDPIEFFAKYIVSKWQIDYAIISGKTSTEEHLQKMDKNFYNVLISCMYDLKIAIANTNRMHPGGPVLSDTSLLTQLAALGSGDLYPISENLELLKRSYELELIRNPGYEILSENYKIWLKIHYEQKINQNEYAITFYRALRNGFTRYCNVCKDDAEAFRQLWQLWINGIEYKYAFVSGHLPENEYNSLLRLAKKMKINENEFTKYIEIFNPSSSRRVARWMAEVYQLWFAEEYTKLAEKIFDKKLPVWLEDSYLWESCLWGIRAAFVSKSFFKNKKIAAPAVKLIDKTRRETHTALSLNLPNPRIRLFWIESGIAKDCTKARNQTDWKRIAQSIAEIEPFPGQIWYKDFAEKMVQELV